MAHIFPILGLIAFIFLVEYRLKKHIDDIDCKITSLEQKVNK